MASGSSAHPRQNDFNIGSGSGSGIGARPGLSPSSSSPNSPAYHQTNHRPTRYQRPHSQTKRAISAGSGPGPGPGSGSGSGSSVGPMISDTADLFAEGTTPTEGAMWRERFHKRMEERERRKRAREEAVDQRRRDASASAPAGGATDKGLVLGQGRGLKGANEDEVVDDEEADRRAQADDEEVSGGLFLPSPVLSSISAT